MNNSKMLLFVIYLCIAMLIVISDAKTLDINPQKLTKQFTIPEYIDQSEQLIKALRKLGPQDISRIMKVNVDLAYLNFDRYLKWHLPFNANNSKQAILLFKGEVYRGIKANNYTEDDLIYAQDHLRILSGLHGILRPLDLIQPYRSEMSIPLQTRKGKNLYEFWGNKITENINTQIKTNNYKCLINLASDEYFKVINTKKVCVPIIHLSFLQRKDEGYKQIVVYTKKARGLMSSFIIKNKLTNYEELKLFDWEGYEFNPHLSDDARWFFTR
jgi:cytoplasmic iron level regulating protein YaaA (DUF328/UPF0246 family)